MHHVTALLGRCQPADLQAKAMRGPNYCIELAAGAGNGRGTCDGSRLAPAAPHACVGQPRETQDQRRGG
jgi:hypothetical protein